MDISNFLANCCNFCGSLPAIFTPDHNLECKLLVKTDNSPGSGFGFLDLGSGGIVLDTFLANGLALSAGSPNRFW